MVLLALGSAVPLDSEISHLRFEMGSVAGKTGDGGAGED